MVRSRAEMRRAVPIRGARSLGPRRERPETPPSAPRYFFLSPSAKKIAPTIESNQSGQKKKPAVPVHRPELYPIWNQASHHAFRRFGGEFPRGMSAGQKYAALARLLQEFREAAGFKDMIDLDAFLWQVFEKDKKAGKHIFT